ncbi:hypothetical protein [Cystobacter fuscus]|uniref:hypothetical protein n=1 Tax=Cystobacter fuscus TaxID=43 RepID=UPI002B2CEA25|nr:hypothetical protein F0U63_47670 [Cystobacter fuscus]
MSNESCPEDVSTGPVVHGYNVPGRNSDSEMPWKFFLGHAAHRLIAYIYGVNHPRNRVFYNKDTLVGILRGERLGDPSRLLPHERSLRPDITDVTIRSVFEIKPWNEKGLQEGQQESMAYVAALNRAVASVKSFSEGRDFHGESLIRFAQGQFIWRLEWRTVVPGVVQYRWTRGQQRFASQEEAYRAGQWVDITEQEMQQYGGWVAQAVDGMVDRRERLAGFSGAVGVAIDIIGGIAVGAFSGFISSGAGAERPSARPPGQGGGQVVPFPSRSTPAVAPALRPTGSGP